MCRGSKLGREWMGGALKILRVPNIHIGRWALGVCRGWVVGVPWECVGVGCWWALGVLVGTGSV